MVAAAQQQREKAVSQVWRAVVGWISFLVQGTGAVLRSPVVAGQRAQGLLRHRRGRCSSRRQQPSWRYLIPILYVSVELVKALQAHIINWDIHMFDEEIGNTTQVCGVDLIDKVVDIIFHVFDANCDGNLSSEEFLRKCLFSMMSDLPSVLEAFTDRKHGKDREEKMAMPRVPGQHLLPPRSMTKTRRSTQRPFAEAAATFTLAATK
ncbi:Calcium uptake protein, mitochondrial [Zea mays]|uniref:Calcium uptake protein, mitochondrial n=1 Tax=Zea mays TaxID=4577 RepID=A0A317Y5C8_MAIZE|nr:Calcium uptake protein, mitochondrial [Zea mays]